MAGGADFLQGNHRAQTKILAYQSRAMPSKNQLSTQRHYLRPGDGRQTLPGLRHKVTEPTSLGLIE